MNADAFRYLYDYHFTENYKIWDKYVAPFLNEQFTQSGTTLIDLFETELFIS